MSKSEKIEEGVLQLADGLDIAHASDIKEAMQQLLEVEGDVALDGSKIIRTDAAGLQLLLAFHQHCEEQSRTLEWKAASQVLLEDVAGLGLARHLEINPQSQGGQ